MVRNFIEKDTPVVPCARTVVSSRAPVTLGVIMIIVYEFGFFGRNLIPCFSSEVGGGRRGAGARAGNT